MKKGFKMGAVLVDEEAIKFEHTIVLSVILCMVLYFFSKYSSVSVDAAAFIVFIAMCYAGYLAMKTAKEIITILEENKYSAYESLKTDSYMIKEPHISPMAFKTNLEFPKYNSSKFSKSVKIAY